MKRPLVAWRLCAVVVVMVLTLAERGLAAAQGAPERVERIDNVLDWVYPLLYAGLIGAVAVVFL